MKICRVVLLAVLSLASSNLFAIAVRDQLLLAELDAWRARTGFHQLSIRGNAPDDIRSQSQLVSAATARTNELTRTLPQAATLNALWERMAERALDNPLATQGYADYHAFRELNELTVAIRDQVRGLVADMPPTPQSQWLELAIRQQRLASEYLALAAFPSAGINTGTQEAPFDFMLEAGEFEQQLASASQGQLAAPEQSALNRVDGRWSFIRGALPQLADAATPRVPMVFYRYSNDMSDALVSLVLDARGRDSIAAYR